MAADETAAARRERLRRAEALLGGLMPDVTQDEIDLDAPTDRSRDEDYRRNRPPHHG